jgi:hypothetical protein
MTRPDGKATPIAEEPWRVQGCQLPHARMHPWPSNAEMMRRVEQQIRNKRVATYVFLLFIYVSNLEPDISVCKGAWRVAQYAVKTMQRVLIFALLFVNYAETKKDLISFVEI